MDRQELLYQLEDTPQPWDILVIGGGATGLGVALDSASRGYRTLLLERDDFAKGTSSRSTKLVHGGVRYLKSGDIGLVMEALKERGLLFKNAPHVVRKEHFVIPAYRPWLSLWYMMGLMIYDLLSLRASFGPSRHISKDEVIRRIPGIRKRDLTGGVIYMDGQFDDARLAINIAQTAVEKGAVVLNHFAVEGLLKGRDGRICGATAKDQMTGRTFEILSKSVINATGVFVDEVLRMDIPGAPPQVRPSQGVHLVLDASFLGGSDAVMIPNTEDGRVLFGVPWEGKLLIGTTDTPLDSHSPEPRALEEEVSFILRTAGQYLERAPGKTDVLSVFAGLRPLAAPTNGEEKTKEISRSHKIIRSPSGMISITGGKWTTYRKMAEDTVDTAISVSGLPFQPCVTKDLCIHGSGIPGRKPIFPGDGHLALYGSDQQALQALESENAEWARPLHTRLPYTGAQVIWAVRKESALTVEDVLARRIRALFLDARAALEMAAPVAALMAAEMGRDTTWEAQQVAAFSKLARGYIL